MTETINIGGVSFSKAEVAQQDVKTKDKTGKDGIREQYKEYTVTLKDGTKITYAEQDAKRKAAVDIQDDGSINFFGLSNATITDTEKDDTYKLIGCEFTRVNAEREDKGFLFPEPADCDNIRQYNRKMPDDSIQEAKGNSAKVNTGDKTDHSIRTIY